MVEKEENNFSLGFVVGALVGVTAYFLTKTKEGQDIKKQASVKWDNIKKKLENEGIISKNTKDFPDIIFNFRKKIFTYLNEEMSKHHKNPSSVKSKRGRPKTKAPEKNEDKTSLRKKMFKGI
ncbi:hypothetical protein KA111_01015 [Candidatus Woesebacteria bacterium]|nr:hypothetical protein [Candidatus Woesebacteria bacterium]